MPRATWTPQAVADIEDIAYYIAVTDGRPAIAEKIVREIHEKADFYAEQPLLAQARPDLAEGLRCARHKPWLIFFEPCDDGIVVHRVIDGRRDYPLLFADER